MTLSSNLYDIDLSQTFTYTLYLSVSLRQCQLILLSNILIGSVFMKSIYKYNTPGVVTVQLLCMFILPW